MMCSSLFVLQVLNEKMNFEGCVFVDSYKFSAGHSVPIYSIETTGAFNQLVGYAKFINAEYGNVYYRGISKLYDNVLPSLMRNRIHGIASDLNKILRVILEDTRLKSSLKLRTVYKTRDPKLYASNKMIDRFNKYTIEALLQHYVGTTRFLDVVDNHWIALWMGAHNFVMHGKGGKYCECVKRNLILGDALEKRSTGYDKEIYVYLLLVAMPHAESCPKYGIIETDGFVEVDLRKALPSIYLRPHAQHALVIRRRDKHNITSDASYYDMAHQVVAILRVRIDKATEWIGNGSLMSAANIFPSPSIDGGYNTLLMRSDIFNNPFEIVKYF